MCSSKTLSSAVALAIVFSVSIAQADWFKPPYATGIYDNSPIIGTDGGASRSIDNLLGTYCKLGPGGDDPAAGYIVYDLGSRQEVDGWQFTSRIHPNNLGPETMQFFYWDNEDVNAHKFTPNSMSSVTADPNVVMSPSFSIPTVNNGASYELDFTSAQKFNARYVGLYFTEGYDTPSGAAITMAEVQFNILVAITGDYNSDGKVDAEDYVIWRKTNINGAQGYTDWRSNFGAGGAGSGAGLDGASVPEPASAVLFVIGLAAPCRWLFQSRLRPRC